MFTDEDFGHATVEPYLGRKLEAFYHIMMPGGVPFVPEGVTKTKFATWWVGNRGKDVKNGLPEFTRFVHAAKVWRQLRNTEFPEHKGDKMPIKMKHLLPLYKSPINLEALWTEVLKREPRGVRYVDSPFISRISTELEDQIAADLHQ